MEVVKVKETARGLGVRIVRMMKNMLMMIIIMMSKIEERMHGDEIDDQPDVQLRGR